MQWVVLIPPYSLVSYQLRTNYLNTIADGVGERLITINDTFLNSTGFKAAGWRPNPATIKRTHSPPIPTAITSEYFQAQPRLAGLTSNGLEDDIDEGGLVTGGGAAGDTVGPGIATKRRRRREQMEEEDSSDLSDDSEDDGDQRAAQQIKFSKMPIRNRSGSSPLRSSNLRQSSTTTSTTTSPAKPIQSRRGSQSALEVVKERARRDTVTSSEMSSENEFDASAFQRQRDATRHAAKASRVLHRHTSDPDVGIQRQQSDLLEEEEEEDSDGSDISEFVGSIDSAMGALGEANNASPTHVVGTVPRELTRSPTKKSKPAPPLLPELPPPRPISMVQPKSLLTAAINAKRTKTAMPFESFALFSGKGDPNPLNLRIWTPFATSTTKPMEVLIRRNVHDTDGKDGPVTDRQVNVADLIGLSLWRYMEEKLEPAIPADKLNVNQWTIRLVEDEEVDYDFPPLERNKLVVSFTTANNRAVRSRSNSKPYDEFALVAATEEQFQQNQKDTPQFKQEAVSQAVTDEFPLPKGTPSSASVLATTVRRHNPLLTTMAARRNYTLADMPAAGATLPSSASRNGTKKLLRVHIHSADATPGQMITLEVTTDTYLAEVLDTICKKRHLDKANHVLKLTGSGTVVLLDRTVDSIGNRTELDLFRRRFATDGPLTMSGSPGGSGSPKLPSITERSELKKIRKGPLMNSHPLAQESIKQDEVESANYKKYIVWRKQPMRFVGLNERILAIDGEYLHIMPASSGKTMFDGQAKTTTVHFSNVVGCKVTRRHPTNFKVCLHQNHCVVLVLTCS